MKQLLCALPLALLLVLPACGGREAAPADPTPTAPAEPQPTPEVAAPQWGTRSLPEIFTAGDGSLVMTVTYAFPSIENDHPAAEAVNRRYEQEAADLLAAAAETSVFCAGDFETAMEVGYSYVPVLEDLTFTITRETAEYASIRRELYTNYGAHPSVFLFSEQFSMADGHALSFADFFPEPEEAIDRILDAIETDPLIAENGLAESARRSFAVDRFYVTDEGFTFWYSPDTFPAQNSPLEIAVPYGELADLAALW